MAFDNSCVLKVISVFCVVLTFYFLWTSVKVFLHTSFFQISKSSHLSIRTNPKSAPLLNKGCNYTSACTLAVHKPFQLINQEKESFCKTCGSAQHRSLTLLQEIAISSTPILFLFNLSWLQLSNGLNRLDRRWSVVWVIQASPGKMTWFTL